MIESFSEYLINRLVSLLQQAEDEDAKLEAELNELMNDSSIHQFVQQRMQVHNCQ